MEGLELTSVRRGLNPGIVAKRDVEWKGWKGQRLDPDVGAGRDAVDGREVN